MRRSGAVGEVDGPARVVATLVCLAEEVPDVVVDGVG